MEEHSFWRGTYEDQIQKAQDDLVTLAGIGLDNFKSYKVSIDFGLKDYSENAKEEEQEEESYIWTYEIGSPNTDKPTIVLVHGYGGSGLIFYRLYKELEKHYHVILFDLLGFGRSSRIPFHATTKEEAEDFFVNSIEKWREAMNLDKMVMCAHSFGGFICGRYAVRHPTKVKKIVFLSALGVDRRPEDCDKRLHEVFNNAPLVTRIGFKTHLFLKRYKIETTPFTMLRTIGRFIAPLAIKNFMRRRMKCIPEEDFVTVYNYLYQIFMRRGSGEAALHVLFEHGIIPYTPIIEVVDDLVEKGIEVSFYYGTKDWMDTAFNGPKVSEILQNEGAKVYIIENSDHHLYFDNPEELLEALHTDLQTKQPSIEA